MIEIYNLKVFVKGKEVLKKINLKINKGEVHAIMGPNGVGKSTLSNVICGKDDFKVKEGSIKFLSQNITGTDITTRARMGIFASNQNPIEIPGVNWNTFLKASINSIRKFQGKERIDSELLIKEINSITEILNIDPNLLARDVNQGFSGGERKKLEILQMLLLKPQLVILDEIDSGLDIDAIKTISKSINNYRNKKNAILIITHYSKILRYIVPNIVHIMYNKEIIKSGGKNLAKEVEISGYSYIFNK